MSLSLSVGPIFAREFTDALTGFASISADMAVVYSPTIGIVMFLVFLFVVESMPETTQQDIVIRGERNPMTSEERSFFFREYGFAIALMVVIYMLNQIFADFMSLYMGVILPVFGYSEEPSSFGWIDVLAGVIIIIPCSLLQLVQSSNMQYFGYVAIQAVSNVALIVVAAIAQMEFINGEVLIDLAKMLNYFAMVPFQSIIFDVFIACMHCRANSTLLCNVFNGVSTLETIIFEIIVKFVPGAATPGLSIPSFCTITALFSFFGLAINMLQLSYQLWNM